MAQEQKQPQTSESEVEEVAPDEAKVADHGALDADIDDILDQIDDVLEANAEDFVKSFVQKGGQ